MEAAVPSPPGGSSAAALARPRRLPESPLTIALALVLVGTPAASVTAADWADHLTWLAVFAGAGVLLALYLARRGVPAGWAHATGLAAGWIAVASYFALAAERGNAFERLGGLGRRIADWIEVAVTGGASSDTLLFSLLVSLLAWSLGYATGWFVFRERAPWWAIVPNGAAILMNLSYAPPELLPFLLVYLLAALLLLVDVTRLRKRDREITLGGSGSEESGQPVLVASAALSVLLIVFAWTLPSGNIVQRVSDAWYSMSGPWQSFQQHFDRLFAALNAPERSGRGLNFGRTLAPRAAFELGEQPVLAIAAREPRYWRAATYDRYTGQVFVSTDPISARTDPDQPRPLDVEPYASRLDFEQRVQILASQTNMLFAADTPIRVNLPAYYDYRDVPDDLVGVRVNVPLRRGDQYTVVSSVSVATVSDLRGASSDYPAWTQRYLRLPRSLPARVREEARRVTQGAETAYDKAIALESYLRQFRYSTRVKQPPPDRDWVDYMLFESKEGYCDYYAAAMAVMLRTLGIPARVASGFAPGDRDPSGEFIVVRESHAHSWTEAYFPGYGWINFEPSALRPVPPRLESFGLDGSLAWDLFGFEDEDYGDLDLEALGLLGASASGTANAGGSPLAAFLTLLVEALAFLAVLVLLGLAVAGVLAIHWQRSLQALREHVRPYAQLYTIAGLCGLRARPSDTPFEYANVVAHEVPPVRRQVLAIVAAYVRGTYGRGHPDEVLLAEAVRAWRGARWMVVKTLLRRNWRRLATSVWRRGGR